MKRIIIITLIGLGALAEGAQAETILPNVTLTLNPADGFLSGAPGSAVGWGYDLSTDSDYVTIEYLSFDDFTSVGMLNVAIAPPSTGATAGDDIVVPWIEGTSGVEYDIDPDAVVGSSTSGGVYVVYDAFTDSTQSDQIVFAQQLYATSAGDPVTAEILVTPGPASVTPEPGTVLLLASGGALLILRKRRKR
jgi:hypothetical protein